MGCRGRPGQYREDQRKGPQQQIVCRGRVQRLTRERGIHADGGCVMVIVGGQAGQVGVKGMAVPLQTIHVKTTGVGLAQMRMQKRTEGEQTQQHPSAETTQPLNDLQIFHNKIIGGAE